MILRRFILGALLALGLASGAHAQTSLLLRNNPDAALQVQVSVDFENALYSPGCTPIANCVSVTRASAVATDLTYFDAAGASFTTYAANTPRIKAGYGLLKEDNRTNFLLNSGTPATQTTGNLTNGSNWLWVNGTGSATLSNGTATGCIGTATQGFPVNFTVAGAGTCTVTVAGSLNQFQLEFGPTIPTSYIATAGATVARGTELIQVVAGSPLAKLLAANQGFVIVATQGIQTGVPLNRDSGNGSLFAQVATASTVRAAATSSNFATASPGITTLAGTNSVGQPNKFATSWGGHGVSFAWNNGTVAHTSPGFKANFAAGNLEIGGTGTTAHITPSTGAVSILLTQLAMTGPTPTTLMRDFWRSAANA